MNLTEEQERGQRDYNYAIVGKRDSWVPGCGGTETPFLTRSGLRVLYCYNPALGRHAYVNLDTDTVLTAFDPLEV